MSISAFKATLPATALPKIGGKTLPRVLKSDDRPEDFYKLYVDISWRETVTLHSLVNRNKNGDLYYVEESIFTGSRRLTGQSPPFISMGGDLTISLRPSRPRSFKPENGRNWAPCPRRSPRLQQPSLTIIIQLRVARSGRRSAGSPWERKSEILMAGKAGRQIDPQLLAFSRNKLRRCSSPYHQVIAGSNEPCPLTARISLAASVPWRGFGPRARRSGHIEQILIIYRQTARRPCRKRELQLNPLRSLDESHHDKPAVIPLGPVSLITTVTTNGSRHSPEDLSHSFEPFSISTPQSARGWHRNSVGHGLLQIVKQTKGYIWFTASRKRGSSSNFLPVFRHITASRRRKTFSAP